MVENDDEFFRDVTSVSLVEEREVEFCRFAGSAGCCDEGSYIEEDVVELGVSGI